MEYPKKVKIDGVDWYITLNIDKTRNLQPLCPIHGLRLYTPHNFREYETIILCCAGCKETYKLPRVVSKERVYIIDKIDSETFKKMKVLNLDDESIPIAETKIKSGDNKYFVTGLLTKSKVGLRLVLYAGKQGHSQKTQIFVEPKIKRLAFDQKDIHPSDVFTKIEATFDDGTKSSINK